MTDRQSRLLIECYLTGQINEKQWQQHLADDASLRDYVKAHFAEYVSAETKAAHAPSPEEIRQTNVARASAFGEWALTTEGFDLVDTVGRDTASAIFLAGWNARKLSELRTGYGWRDKL